MRRTKIVVTLGPKSWDGQVIRGMILAGADIFRLNLSHVKSERDYTFLTKIVRLIKEIAVAVGRTVEIMADCPGHKFRLGYLVARELRLGQIVTLSPQQTVDNGNLPFPYKKFLAKMKPGQEVVVGDGRPRFSVREQAPPNVVCEVILPGLLEPNKGITVRGLNIGGLNLSSLTKADEVGLRFAVDIRADEVVMSYGTSAAQIDGFINFYRQLGGTGKVRFKYELEEAGSDLEGIVATSDSGYVGQGDLGLSITHHRVPVEAAKVVRAFRQAGKSCIVGTQLLTSMKENPFPTHGETAGICYHVIQGASGLVVSDETSVGNHPVRVVEVLAATIEQAESL